MSYISEKDRNYIENKYHKKGDPNFNPLQRFNYHGYEYDPATGLDDAQMAAGLEKLIEETKGQDHALVKAKCFAFVLDNARIDAPAEDYFFGFYNWGRPLGKTLISKWYNEVFASMPKVMQIMEDYEASGTGELCLDTDHVVPDWRDIFGLGFTGLKDRARKYYEERKNERNNMSGVFCEEEGTEGGLTPKQEAFFASIQIEYEAILRLIDRLADYTEEHPSEKSDLIVRSFRSLRNNPPQNTFEALLMMYTFHICSESVDMYQVRSLGNGLDRSLYAFYKKDLEEGVFTREQIRTFLAYLFMQYAAIDNYWGQPFYLCGTDFDETTDISDLTLDILEVYDSLNIYNPKIQIKIDYHTNPRIIHKALEMIRAGHNSIVFCCVPGITKSLTTCYGVTEEEARNCDISGCNEMHIRGSEACMISGYPNAAKALCYVFNNGLDTITGKQLGLTTGDVTTFRTYEDFYDAFIKQFSYMLDTFLDTARAYEKYVSEICPSVMLSATIESSLQKAVDAYGFGVKYPTSCLLLCSFATTVDSLLAVKELVFEKEKTTLAEMREALLHNWEGHEELRQEALRAELKYGNGNPRADALAAELFQWFSHYVTGQKNSRGGVYKVGVPSTRHFIGQGRVTEATPDGRKKGEECSKNAAPVVGMERKGVTAMIRSALSTQPWLFSEAYVLDVMLHPSVFEGEDGLQAVKGLIDMYMKNDGISIQFNVFSAQTLRDAQEHPEKYENLQVRISGWNVLWNNMSREEQDAYIKRAEGLGGTAK